MADPQRPDADYERTYQAYAHLFCRSCGRLGSHCSCVEYCDPACLEVNGGPCDTDGGGPCKDALTDGSAAISGGERD